MGWHCACVRPADWPGLLRLFFSIAVGESVHSLGLVFSYGDDCKGQSLPL